MIDKSELVKIINSNKRKRELYNERRERKAELEKITEKLGNLNIKLERLKDIFLSKQAYMANLHQCISVNEKEMESIESSMNNIKTEIKNLKKQLEEKGNDLSEWEFITKNELAKLELEQNNNIEYANKEKTTINNWK